MSTEQGPFGFGQNVTGGTGTPVTVADRTALVAALRQPLDGKILEIGTQNGGDFNFAGMNDGQQLVIAAKNLTIRANTSFNNVLRNMQFRVDLDRSDNILFENLTFRSDGAEDGARDAILLLATRPAEGVTSTATANVRITRCSFDGYYDIAIDSQNVAGRPELRATIDRCFFFDSRPGSLGSGNAKFFNRGAINISVAGEDHDEDQDADDDRNRNRNRNNAQTTPPRPLGNSSFTVAYNVFIDVWRRSPRVAEGNTAHVFNNLLYRWGYTAAPNSDQTWRGMEVGGGISGPRGNNGRALIQANRFIPWQDKRDPLVAIKVHKGTAVDFGVQSSNIDQPGAVDDSRPNRYDKPNGRVPDAPQSFDAGASLALININRLYGSLKPPAVLQTTAVQWDTDILANAGPANATETNAVALKNDLAAVLRNAAKPGKSGTPG